MRSLCLSGVTLVGLLCFIQFVQADDDTEKRKLEAQQLVERLDSLTEDERERLLELGDEAFEAVLGLVKELLPECEKGPQRYLVHRCSCMTTVRFETALSALRRFAKKKHAPEMMSLLREPNSQAVGNFVLNWFYDEFGEKQSLPLFFKILQNDPLLKHNKFCTEGLILRILYDSSDSRVIEFFFEQLSDLNAPPLYRNLAFTSLARTAGEKGLETVLASRDRQRTTSVIKHGGLEKLGATVQMGPREEHSRSMEAELVDTRQDTTGVLWGLISSPTLGSRKDLWIARWLGERWSEPLFTGSTLESMKGSNWYLKFVGNAEIGRDSDGDTLTDLVERRLGTNPDQADTDGDGLKDSIDKNPTAAPRKLNDLEQVLAAAFEAVFRYVGWDEVPAFVTLPEGVEPMEFMGWDRVVIVRRAEDKRPKGWVISDDAMNVSFSIGVWSTKLEEKGWQRQRLLVLWNKDRTEARLRVDADYRGTSLHLRKFGDDWVVLWSGATRVHDMHVIHDDME